MHIFIDESGSFVPSPGKPVVSLVAALVVPEGRFAHIERKYKNLRRQLPKERGEVKGKLLTEPAVADVVDLLRRNECLLEIVAVELHTHSDADMEWHKNDLADRMIAGLTNAHHPNVRRGVGDLAARVRALANQLYLQSTAMTELVRHTIDHATNYYAQRRPEELAAYRWVVDGKDKNRTTAAEQLWLRIVLPLLMARSVRDPMGFFEGGDYSFFDRFVGESPDWLPKPKGADDGATDIKLLMTEHFRYSSDGEVGLELVDILANAARRALIGSLSMEGWKGLPTLMIHRRQQYIHVVTLHTRSTRPHPQHERVLRHFTRRGRVMLAPRFLQDE